MKKLVILFALLCFATISCKSKNSTPAKTTQKAAIEQKKTDTISFLQKCVAAQVAIEHMRRATKRPDYAAIEQKLNTCNPLLRETDETYKTTYITDINKAIDNCKKGKSPKVNQQVFAKGLQHAVVLKIKELLLSVDQKTTTEKMADVKKVSILFNGIRPTFIRRDAGYYKGVKTLEKEADTLLFKMAKAAQQSRTLLPIIKQFFDTIHKTYALSALYEVQEIEKYRDKNSAKCDVKRAEAVIFYSIIAPVIKKKSRKIHEEISAMLKAPYASFDAGKLEKLFNKGLGFAIK